MRRVVRALRYHHFGCQVGKVKHVLAGGRDYEEEIDWGSCRIMLPQRGAACVIDGRGFHRTPPFEDGRLFKDVHSGGLGDDHFALRPDTRHPPVPLDVLGVIY